MNLTFRLRNYSKIYIIQIWNTCGRKSGLVLPIKISSSKRGLSPVSLVYRYVYIDIYIPYFSLSHVKFHRGKLQPPQGFSEVIIVSLENRQFGACYLILSEWKYFLPEKYTFAYCYIRKEIVYFEMII